MYKSCLNLSTRKNIIKSITLLLSILSFSSLLFAKDTRTDLQKETARSYRAQGLEYQHAGDLDTAMSFYQKAIELDPFYAIAYNDLGIIYEAKGNSEQAGECYLKAIQIDPNYLSPYSNLALFYENKRNLPKAAFYWEKRAGLGFSRDPWTAKARKRLNDIQAVLAEESVDSKEQDIINFMKDIAGQKAAIEQDNKALAKQHFKRAKLSYKRKEWLTALKEAIDAKSLDPDNQGIDDFIDKVKIRLISK